MNSRELALLSTATEFGTLASALAFRFFLNPKKHFSRTSSSENGVLSIKRSSRSPFDPSKRQGYLSWDDYFMAIAFLSAERSEDPNRQVGACLVSQNGVILDEFKTASKVSSKVFNGLAIMDFREAVLMTSFLGQSYVCHAEVNAILNTNHASAAGRAGVSKVIYFVEKRPSDSDIAYIASNKLLSMAGVKVRKHQPKMNEILIKFEEP